MSFNIEDYPEPTTEQLVKFLGFYARLGGLPDKYSKEDAETIKHNLEHDSEYRESAIRMHREFQIEDLQRLKNEGKL